MINYKVLAEIRKSTSASEIPFLLEQLEKAVQQQPYKGLRIFHNIPLTLATLLKVEVLVSGGADVVVASPQLLLVEDNLLNQKVLKIMLEEMGCQLDIASDGNQALSMYQQKAYDLVFMDVGLPDMDGLYVTSAIRKLEQNAHKVPIINITAHVFKEDIDNCLKAGADDVIGKPVMRDKLVEILKKWLGKTHKH